MNEKDEIVLDNGRFIYENDLQAQPIATIPTKRNPDVLVTIGQKSDGSFVPMRISYPESYGIDIVQQKLTAYKAQDGCELCDRFEREQKQRKVYKQYSDKQFPILALISDQRPSIMGFITRARGSL